MAATTSKSLGEHLQEQQKPFVLDIYLSERRRMLNKNPYRPCSCSLNKRRILCTKKILKLVFYKFTCTSQSQKVSSCHQAHKLQPVSRIIEKSKGIRGTNRFPKLSMSSSAAFPASLKCAVRDSPCHENRASLLARISRALKHGSMKEKEVHKLN
uniref:Uncharacterized protein LOC105129784 isoform X1 n=1 Tax=Rhizophora mucronata TaxID=61149 RepID=A0A2P2J5H7_RHIMU